MRIAAWQIKNGVPIPTPRHVIDLEAHLEDWIERDPALVAGGLRIVGRQVRLGAAGRTDLVAIDPADRWVVIEIKAGSLYRETIAQALDYAAALADLDPSALRDLTTAYQMSHDGEGLSDAQLGLPREVVVIVVGTETDAGLDRLSAYLSRFGVPIRAVAFQVLLVEGEPMLLREITETVDTQHPTSGYQVEDVLALADGAGLGNAMRTIVDAAQRHGLFPAPKKTCIMVAPPTNHTRCLMTFWSNGWCYREPDAFTEFFDVSSDQATAALGPQGYDKFDDEVAQTIPVALDSLLGDADS